VMIITDDDTGWELMTTSLLLALCFGSMTAAETARRRNRLAVSMVLSMLLTAAGACAMIVLVWFEHQLEGADQIGRWGGVTLACGIALAHSGALSLVPASSKLVLGLKAAVIFCAWLVFAFILLLVLIQEASGGFAGAMNMFWIVGMIMFLVAGTIIGTIAVPIAAVSRANRIEPPIESMKSTQTVILGCPKCGFKGEVRTGHSRCTNCGVGLLIDVEEPRCECGYLLYRLQGDTCPECGRAVPSIPAAPSTVAPIAGM
jgi:hypothetical protein